MWAATNTGRVFITDNANAAPATSVAWTRLDPSSTVDPSRFVSSIYIDPANANHAWISYSGYNINTPGTPGHVFEVTRTGADGDVGRSQLRPAPTCRSPTSFATT